MHKAGQVVRRFVSRACVSMQVMANAVSTMILPVAGPLPKRPVLWDLGPPKPIC